MLFMKSRCLDPTADRQRCCGDSDIVLFVPHILCTHLCSHIRQIPITELYIHYLWQLAVLFKGYPQAMESIQSCWAGSQNTCNILRLMFFQADSNFKLTSTHQAWTSILDLHSLTSDQVLLTMTWCNLRRTTFFIFDCTQKVSELTQLGHP